MSQRIFLMLGLFVLLLLGLTSILSINTEMVSEPQLLFPELKKKVAEIDKLEIITTTETTTIVRKDDQWLVAQRDDYDAQREELSNLVLQLVDLRLKEKKTSKEENFALLGVSDLDIVDSDATRINLHSEGQIFSALFGNQSSGRKGRFVRLGNQVWLADEIKILKKVTEWLEPIVIDVDPEDIVRVEMGSLVFERDPDGGFEVSPLPITKQLKYPSVSQEPARALTKVRLEDVSPHDPRRWESARRATFFLRNGTEIEALASKRKENFWLHFSTLKRLDSELVLEFGDNAGESGINSKEKNVLYQKSLSDWDFNVSNYVYDDFVLDLDDIFKDKLDSK
ncbi:MAG: hypothetical protein CMP95_10955 [Gammaproteobacteria bacterium]|nr:hypothetical protein [Gammaproteobacteria bacterium]OUV66993.1 MAG: hypothetical protein CBC93_06735 [Gammaproteobacteria bacterium TMED133]